MPYAVTNYYNIPIKGFDTYATTSHNENVVAVGYDPIGITYDPIHRTMYVTNSDSNKVSVINTSTNTVTGNYATGAKNATEIEYDTIPP